MTTDVSLNVDRECSYCDEDAKYVWIRLGFFGLKVSFLCEKHNKMKKNLK